MNSIIRAMAVLNDICSRSPRDRLDRLVQHAVLLGRGLDVAARPALSCIASARSSMIIRHTRSRKPRTPLTPSMLQGLTASSGPMNISYSRRASAPYSCTTWSGLTTLPRLFDILYARFSRRGHSDRLGTNVSPRFSPSSC